MSVNAHGLILSYRQKSLIEFVSLTDLCDEVEQHEVCECVCVSYSV